MGSELKDTDFMRMIMEAAQKAGDEPPPMDSPDYTQWVDRITQMISEQVQQQGYEQGKNEDGTMWVMIQPTAEFVVKTRNNNEKVFVNICSSDKIKAPQPFGTPDDTEEIKWRVPLSAGPQRTDKDKEGKECKVYDVVYNTETIRRASEDVEFKQLVISLALQYLKQKSETELSDEFTLPKLKSKGTIMKQRVRVEAPTQQSSKLGELDLPTKKAPTVTPVRHQQPLIQEIKSSDLPSSYVEKTYNNSESNINDYSKESKMKYIIECQGKHEENSNIPETMVVDIQFPVQVQSNDISTDSQLSQIIIRCETLQDTLTITLPYPHDIDKCKAQFIKKRNILKLTLKTSLESLAKHTQIEQDKEKTTLELLEKEAIEEAEYAKRFMVKQEEEKVMKQKEIQQQISQEAVVNPIQENAKKKVLEKQSQRESPSDTKSSDVNDSNTVQNNKDDKEDEDKLIRERIYGNTPLKMKDLFGVEFKNRYLFALDIEL